MSYAPDAAIYALGTTIAKAGSKDAFRYVDYELPLAFAKAAHAAGVGTYGIVTAMGASATSMAFYLKTKGDVEREIRGSVFARLRFAGRALSAESEKKNEPAKEWR